MVSSFFGPKPPIFGAAGADQSSRILPILRGPTAKNQDQVLEERKSIFLEDGPYLAPRGVYTYSVVYLIRISFIAAR